MELSSSSWCICSSQYDCVTWSLTLQLSKSSVFGSLRGNVSPSVKMCDPVSTDVAVAGQKDVFLWIVLQIVIGGGLYSNSRSGRDSLHVPTAVPTTVWLDCTQLWTLFILPVTYWAWLIVICWQTTTSPFCVQKLTHLNTYLFLFTGSYFSVIFYECVHTQFIV